PFSARRLRMAANCSAVQHVLPIISEAKLDQRFQERIPYALLSPATKPDVDGIPFPISLMHITPRAAVPKHVQHTVHELAIIMRRTGLPSALCRKKRLHDRHSASVRSPRAITVS